MEHTRPTHVVGVDLDRTAFRAAVRDSGLSLRELADRSGLSYSTWKKLHSGRRCWPKRDTYRRVVHALGYPRGSLTLDPTQNTHVPHMGGGE
ncbi:helix-turn-helix domain-containing protein [Nocardiopsis synnemataformans]|uniref:helix-turn-helix domain-containing protein n=1 Tax=Nocardiopsis synnemataformans TaxID=61305 RepID=UPI003EBEF7FE